jgi:hypothetical protein
MVITTMATTMIAIMSNGDYYLAQREGGTSEPLPLA